MFRKFLALTAMMALFMTSAHAQDWGLDTYDTYDPGFYDSTSSDLYDANDDWFYDSYTYGSEDQEYDDEGILDDSYEWESDDELFDTDL